MFFPDPLYGSLLLINGALALVVSAFVLSRDYHYLLNRLTSAAFAGFFLYLFFEGLIYFFQTEDLLISNILRKLSVIGVMTGATSILLAGIVVRFGPDYFRGHQRLFIGFFAMTAVITILALITESVEIQLVADGSRYLVFKGDLLSVAFSHGYPICLIIIGLLLFFSVYLQTRQTDKQLSKKLLLLDVSLTIVVLGALWMAVIRMVFEGQNIFPGFYLPGHVLYFIGAILAVLAFRSRTT